MKSGGPESVVSNAGEGIQRVDQGRRQIRVSSQLGTNWTSTLLRRQSGSGARRTGLLMCVWVNKKADTLTKRNSSRDENTGTWRDVYRHLFTYLCLSTYSTEPEAYWGSLMSLLYTTYRVRSHLQLLALSILTCCPNMSFLARLVSDNSRSLEKFELERLSSQPPLRKNVCSASEFLYIATYMSYLTFLAPLTSEL